MYEEAGAGLGLDARYDARKLHNPNGLELSSLAATEELSINGLPLFTQPTVIPLVVRVPSAGTYLLQAEPLNVLTGTRLTLVDGQTGQQVLLTNTGGALALVANSASTWRNRFYLNWEPSATPLETAKALGAFNVEIYPAPAKAGTDLTVLVPAVAGAHQVSAILYNSLGQQLRQEPAQPLAQAGASLRVSTRGLAPGVYVLRILAGKATAVRSVIVE
ncbi:T9SS type A sorting domain-containing protein [Hymenobacter edaphi]|uniref:T9SS type A sorting domain-containing protein n=1 Tax=Hymenobacter edaphi TaxID=2211146 RepID=UPI00140323D2|nr:T9SS type A sorting domain-containing protein [Hymenobacter edaphi]